MLTNKCDSDSCEDLELIDYEYIHFIKSELKQIIRRVEHYKRFHKDDNDAQIQIDNTIKVIYSWLNPLTDLYKIMKVITYNNLSSVNNLNVFNEENNKTKNKIVSDIDEIKRSYPKALTSTEFDTFERLLVDYNYAINKFTERITT